MKPIHAAQYRIAGPTAGMRMLRAITGLHRWKLRAWIEYHPDHAPIDIVQGKPRRRKGDEHEIVINQPCLPSSLVPLYEKSIAELCKGTPIVVQGGFDAFILPRGLNAQMCICTK